MLRNGKIGKLMNEQDIKDFIHFFTHKKGLTSKQQSQRDRLLSRDYLRLSTQEEGRDGEDVSIEISDLLVKEEYVETKPSESEKTRIHCPQELVSFLNSFTLKGGTIKYTTHPWDEEGKSFESFDIFVEKYQKELSTHTFWKKSEGGSSRIYRCSSSIYYIIRNFLLEKGDGISHDKKPLNYWGNRFYIGYQVNGILKKWMDKNPGKQPYEMPLAEYPKDYIPNVEGKNYILFEDVVNEFKSLIEFRGRSLFNTLRTSFSGPGLNIDKEKLESLKGKTLYTDVTSVKNAIRRIAFNIKSRSEHPNVEIWADFEADVKGSKKIVLHILHVNSFSDTSLNSDKLQLKGKGDMIDIKESLIGLCDFSVISRFDKDGVKNTYKIDYLYDENPYIEPRITQLDSKPSGFEYLLYFYL